MEEVKTCPRCKKEFIVKWFEYPANVDNKRESYMNCPYCNAVTERVMVGKRQEFQERKKEENNFCKKGKI